MVRQFVLEEPSDFFAPFVAQQPGDERVTEAVVLVNRSGLVVSPVGTENAEGVPIVQQRTQFSLRSPNPLRIVLHGVRVRRSDRVCRDECGRSVRPVVDRKRRSRSRKCAQLGTLIPVAEWHR